MRLRASFHSVANCSSSLLLVPNPAALAPLAQAWVGPNG